MRILANKIKGLSDSQTWFQSHLLTNNREEPARGFNKILFALSVLPDFAWRTISNLLVQVVLKIPKVIFFFNRKVGGNMVQFNP